MKPSDCHSLNCEIAICALPCLVNKTRYTLFIDSSASNDVASSWNLGASGGAKAPFSGFVLVKFNSTKSVRPSRSES